MPGINLLTSRVLLSLSCARGNFPNPHFNHFHVLMEMECPQGIYKQLQPLPPGFLNKGNCCYANCILQCLMNSAKLRWLCRCLLDSHSNFCLDCKIKGIQSINSLFYTPLICAIIIVPMNPPPISFKVSFNIYTSIKLIIVPMNPPPISFI